MQRNDFFFQALMIGGFTFCYFAPEIFDEPRNEFCEAKFYLANAMFAWVLLSIDAMFSLGWIMVYAHMRYKNASSQLMFEFIERATIVQAIGKLLNRYLGFSLFFYISQALLWPKSSRSCNEGIDYADSLTWKLLLLITAPYAILLFLSILGVIICAPCIY